MGLPWRAISLASLVAAYLAASRQPHWSSGFFALSFAGVWAAQFFCWGVWASLLYPKVFSPLRDIPGPTDGSWLHGQYARIVKDPSGAPQLEWINSIPNDGLIRYLGLFNQERLLITTPKALAEVLVTKNYDFQKPAQVKAFLSRLLGVGVLVAEGDEHKFQRKNLMPAFAFRHVKDLYPVFWAKARESVQAMTAQVLRDAAQPPPPPPPTDAEKEAGSSTPSKDTAVIEVGQWASRTTLDIIGVAGMGRDFGAIRDPANPLATTYNHVFRPSKQARLLGMLGLLLPDWVVSNIPVQRNSDIYTARRLIREVCRDLIREKKARLARKELTDVDILSVAIESGGFSDENLVDQLMTFLAAGHETTSSAMTWAVYLLAVHPEVQRRLREEVRARLPPAGDDAAAISSLDVDHMPYLNAVCSEVLRCFSPVPVTLREAAVDTSIAGHPVPRGTRIMLVPWAVNKDVHMWGPDAMRFDPDRWLAKPSADAAAAASATNSGGATSNYAFMTFLHGPRSCIGMGFARAEFACLLAAWVGRFEFSLKNEEERDETKLGIRGTVSARPANGLYVNAKVLDGW